MREKILQMFRDNPFSAISYDEILCEVGVGITDLDAEIFLELIVLEQEGIVESDDCGQSFEKGPAFPAY